MTFRIPTCAALALLGGFALVPDAGAQTQSPSDSRNAVPAPSAIPGNNTMPGNTMQPGGTMVRPGDTPGAVPPAPGTASGNRAVPGATTRPGNDTGASPGNVGGNAVRTGDTTVGGLTPGANSFTEGQARSRIESAGYGNVTELRLDEQGIWRGRAMRDGRQVTVGLDYQGNVAAQ
ncbi:MAG TPA: hypothetical protein VD970_17500 [Acetobacteraceae bacterium]|nr:hypothetical protein [Acetobacteraceae bacterium]